MDEGSNAASPAASPIPVNNLVTLGKSLTAPAIASEVYVGTLAVWTDSSDQSIYMASDATNPPWTPEQINPDWYSTDTPAVAIAPGWNDVFIAWIQQGTGSILLSNAASNWNTVTILYDASTGGGSAFGPALSFSDTDNVLYFAFVDSSSNFVSGTYAQDGTVQFYTSQFALSSRPTLMTEAGYVWALSGGDDLSDGGPMLYLRSTDGGQSFEKFAGLEYLCVGPPTMFKYGLTYTIAFASSKDQSQLDTLYTQDFIIYQEQLYTNQCHEGGPGLSLTADFSSFTAGWSVGASGPTLHDVVVGQLPLSLSLAQMPSPNETEQTRRIMKLHRPDAPSPCGTNPNLVYDPSTGECVSKWGCVGGCVLSSYTSSPLGPIFNPISYGFCVIKCELSA